MMVCLREGCCSRLPIEVFFHLFKLFYGFFYHSQGGIVPFLPCLLLRNNGGKLFLFFLLYLLLAHLELLLLHAVMAHPELDTKAQKRRQGIMVNDTKVVAVMHYRVYITFCSFSSVTLNAIIFVLSSCFGSLDIFFLIDCSI
jgi:hypothetical protein